MLKSKISINKKLLFLSFICICWLLPFSDTAIRSYSQDGILKALVGVLVFVGTIVFYYICKKSILKLLLMLFDIAVFAVIIGYEYVLTVFSGFAVIYVYKSSIEEDSKNEIINNILLVLAPLAAIAGLVINFKAIINNIAEIGLYLAIFAIFFLVLIKYSREKKSKKKLEKINKRDRELEKKNESRRRAVFIISLIGILSSAASYRFTYNNSLSFFPWFCFILMLLYENDKTVYSAGAMLENKIKAFLE